MGLDAKIGEKEAEKREKRGEKEGGESENTESLMKRYTRGS